MVFYTVRIQGETFWKKQFGEQEVSFFIKWRKKLFPVKRNIFIQGNKCENKIKKELTTFSNKLSTK